MRREAPSLALAILTETINRARLNEQDPLPEAVFDDPAASLAWQARARVLHDLINTAIGESQLASEIIAQLADWAAEFLELLAGSQRNGALSVVQEIALSLEQDGSA